MRPRPPPIPQPTRVSYNLGLVDSLAGIGRAQYADVIVQLVAMTRSDINGMPCLIVWDGSDWPHDRRPMRGIDIEEDREFELPPDPAIKEKSKGRTVTIFCYDYDNQCVNPIQSGDWLYVQNVHCRFEKESPFVSLMMHDNIRPRYIWRLDLPMADGLFYEKQWEASIARVDEVQPLPAGVVAQRQQQLHPAVVVSPFVSPTSAASSSHLPALAASNRLQQLVIDGLLTEGLRMPTSEAVLEEGAQAVIAVFRKAAAASAAPPAAAAQQPKPTSKKIADGAAAAFLASMAPTVQQVASSNQPKQSPRSPRKTAAAATRSPASGTRAGAAAAAPTAMQSPGPSTPRSSRTSVVTATSPMTTRAAAAAAEAAAGPSTSTARSPRKRGPSITSKQEEEPEEKKRTLRSNEGRTPPPQLKQRMFDAMKKK